ncbi:MAG: ABC transporter substrate-binding protein [Chlamydiae bacterium]|nr:ABC transporter substrate-binding protein [Chlamydiota bacterium]
MKKSLILLLFCIFAVLSGSCKAKNTLKVAATPTPHAELLAFIKPDLEKEGVSLEIIEIEDYNLPNRSLSEKQIDANFFQHIPFLEKQMQEFGYKLQALAKIHIEPMGIYSKRISDLSQVPDKGIVAIPSDPSNEKRALQLLEKSGLITLQKENRQKGTILDIVDNPKGLQILEVDAAMLPRSLQDTDISVIPTNFALQAHLNPLENALFLEDKNSSYANVIVIREGDASREDITKLVKLMTSEKMKNHILEKYHGAIIPAFTPVQE